jgi:hypothetical protein
MKQQSAYTKMLYDLVSEKIGSQSKGKIRLDFSDSKHYGCMTELFGGEENMKKNFPYNYNVLETSRSNGPAMTDNAGTTGFVDFSRIQSIFYAKNTKELSTMSYANLTSVAKSIYLTTTVFRKGEQIGFNSGFSFNVSNAVLETLTKDILPLGGDDDVLVVFHVSWQKNNVMYSEVNYDLKNSRESSLNEIVKEITVNDPTNRNTPADSAIYVTFGRTPANGEVLDYSYPESRIERLQKMFLEISGEATLIDGAKFVSGNPNQTGIVLNHPDMGTIFYNQTLPASCIQKLSDSKFKWTIDKDWQNTIPSSVEAGIREYAFDMSLSFSAIRANESKPSNYTIEIASFEKPLENPHYKKINNIKLRWGCLADNSRVRMADGSQKMIHEIAVGDMVRTPEGGSREVVNVWTGTETEILHIETDGGAVINLTDTHPVMTKEGLKPACALTFDDQFLMEGGQYQKIQFFYTLPYDRNVYNLDLKDGHTFICDDFVVGDNMMQNTVHVKDMSPVTADAELVREIEKLEKMYN